MQAQNFKKIIFNLSSAFFEVVFLEEAFNLSRFFFIYNHNKFSFNSLTKLLIDFKSLIFQQFINMRFANMSASVCGNA